MQTYHDHFAARLDARRKRQEAAEFLLKLSTQPAPAPSPVRAIRRPQPKPEEAAS